MKRNLTLLSYLMIATALIFTSCKKDEPLSEEQKAVNELSATWNITGATAGTETITLSGVSFTFNSDMTYSISGVNVLETNNLNNDESFESQGSFSLSGSSFNLLSLGTGTQFTITSVNQETGAISLTYSSKYPKTTSPSVSITLNGELAN